jgi:hypothetical protein
LTTAKFAHFVSDFFHVPDDFVPEDERQLWLGQFAIEHVQIGPAYGAGSYTYEHLTGLRFGLQHLFRSQPLPR